MRVVFRVIGNNVVGMGHIYRCLSLAHGMANQDILFVCDVDSESVVKRLVGPVYWLGVYDTKNIADKIISLNPDLVVNDVLNTEKTYVEYLKKEEIFVVNFEDLGSGASVADLTVNELYDYPILSGNNILWGYEHFFVREEFEKARPNKFRESVAEVILTFGGTDQHDLSRLVYERINEICRKYQIFIRIVTGPGYRGFTRLEKIVSKASGVSLTHATGVISSIMENADIAITSNGRTVYELAHMNIPGIVIPQHEREETHSFAREENGFIKLEPYVEGMSLEKVPQLLEKLIANKQFRNSLFSRLEKFCFLQNKQRLLDKIFDRCKDRKKILQHG